MIADPWFYAVAIPAVILVGLSKGGFAGFSTLSLPLLALQISPLRGAVIMLPILIVQDIVSVWAYWRKWDNANLKVLFPGAFIGIFAGYLLAAYVSDAAVKLALGIISLVFGSRYLLAEVADAARSASAHRAAARSGPPERNERTAQVASAAASAARAPGAGTLCSR